jgi:hypothetical protein
VALDRFLRTGSARLTRLFRDVDARADAIRRIQVIHRKARELLEERGIRAGYLASGIARWDELFLEPAAQAELARLREAYQWAVAAADPPAGEPPAGEPPPGDPRAGGQTGPAGPGHEVIQRSAARGPGGIVGQQGDVQ